jgi:hypothetical protein
MILVSCSSQHESTVVAGRRNHPSLLCPLVPGTSATFPLPLPLPWSASSHSASPLSLRSTPYSFHVFAVATRGRIYLFPACTYPRSWTSAAPTLSRCPSSPVAPLPCILVVAPTSTRRGVLSVVVVGAEQAGQAGVEDTTRMSSRD